MNPGMQSKLERRLSIEFEQDLGSEDHKRMNLQPPMIQWEEQILMLVTTRCWVHFNFQYCNEHNVHLGI